MQVAKERESIGKALGAAVAHPLRAQCLTILADRVASPVEISREIHKDVSGISYHVRALQELGLVEEVGQRPVRGAVEHYYRAVIRPCISSEEEADQTLQDRNVFAQVILSVFAANASTALDSGTFVDRADHHATRVPIRVDEQGWSELTEAYLELFEQVYEIQSESAERLGRKPDDPGIPAISFLALFEMPKDQRVK
jgi:DNA-binding transcriptional ArsR family regulator